MSEERTFTFEATDSLTKRAQKLAQLAFADFANDRHGMSERAAFRIAQALEYYANADARPRSKPLADTTTKPESQG